MTGPNDRVIIAGDRTKQESWLDYLYVAVWILSYTATFEKEDSNKLTRAMTMCPVMPS